MALRRPNNMRRTEWNKKCRETLSAHIYRRLGITIEASQVRLKTNADDPYTWEKMEEKGQLFSKNLSDLSTGQLKDLCDGVDKWYTAIWKAPLQPQIPAQGGEEFTLDISKRDVSFVARIDNLHQENDRLNREISKWEHRVNHESELRRTAESEAKTLEVTIKKLRMDSQKLEEHLIEWKHTAEKHKSDEDKHCRGIHKILTALQEVQFDLDCACVKSTLEVEL